MVAAGRLFAAEALLPSGWARDVLLEWDQAGTFTAVTAGVGRPRDVAAAGGPVVPGMPNLHSHAFQRAFAGLTETRGSSDDSFWTWRERMYRVANAITPDALNAIATHLYIEMLEGGYTSVCEFHYLHNEADGRPYADDAVLATTLAGAAAEAGIGLTMLPVLYQQGGFGQRPPTPGQRRFIRGTDSLLELIGSLSGRGNIPRVGLALHSLRAVTPEALRDALQGLAGIDSTAPVHIHVAEQAREVEECLAWSGQRPVDWLLDHVPVNVRWCLVHATHMTPDEAARAAATGAVAGLCPTTEANLGDGTFGMGPWAVAGGRWGIGSDSHVTVDAVDELRMLEYSQRLATGQRNVVASAGEPHVGTAMTLAAVAGGAAAAGRSIRGLDAGQRADFVELDSAHPLLDGLPGADALDAAVFARGLRPPVATVFVGGRTVVAAGRHPHRESAAAAFAHARAALAAHPA